MNTDGSVLVTQRIIGCAIRVSNTLGCGFLESVYEAALAHDLAKNDLLVKRQEPLSIFYDGVVVGNYRTDLVVNEAVIVEVKAAKAIDLMHQAQLLNYLRATGLSVGLILNFGTPHLGIKRMVL
jgi:GxxExxY protein